MTRKRQQERKEQKSGLTARPNPVPDALNSSRDLSPLPGGHSTTKNTALHVQAMTTNPRMLVQNHHPIACCRSHVPVSKEGCEPEGYYPHATCADLAECELLLTADTVIVVSCRYRRPLADVVDFDFGEATLQRYAFQRGRHRSQEQEREP